MVYKSHLSGSDRERTVRSALNGPSASITTAKVALINHTECTAKMHSISLSSKAKLKFCPVDRLPSWKNHALPSVPSKIARRALACLEKGGRAISLG